MRAFDGEVIAIALREGILYQMTFTKVCEMHVANLAQTSTIDGALELWHRRLGHLNIKGVHALQNMVSGMNLGNMPCPTSSFVCEGCIEGKQHCKPFPSDGGMHASKPLEILKWLKSRLEDEFEMSDLGELHYCLGVEFERDRANHTITMSQRKYIEEVLKRFNMEECKPIGTPLDVNSKLLKLTEEEFQRIQEEMQGIPYKAAVGSLMYSMVRTRPDLAFPVSMVSKFKGWSFPLDGGETHHAVLEGYFGPEIVPWTQGG